MHSPESIRKGSRHSGHRHALWALLACWLPMLVVAQRDAYWHFGDSVVLRWDTSGPVVQPKSAMAAWEPSASISDTAGNLLFYTNGNRIWNRNDQPMPNGDSVIPAPDYDPFYSNTQGTLILPFPDHPNQYYVFYLGYRLSRIEFLYSVIDMDLDGGLGDVIPGRKGVVVDASGYSEKMTAVRHGNGRDWWVIVFRNWNYDLNQADSSYYYYLLTPGGLQLSHVQSIGLSGLNRGEMVISEDGERIGMAGVGGVQVYGFDRCSGLLTDPLMRLPDQWGYGAAFSPSGRYFYFTSEFHKELFQYDLDPTINVDTLELIYEGSTPSIIFGQLSLGLDGKIYMAVWKNLSSAPVDQYLHVIHAPDLPGIVSDFEALSLFLEGKRAPGGLPNTINYTLGRLEGSPCDTVYAVDSTTTTVVPVLVPEGWAVVPTVSGGHYRLTGPSAEGQIVHVRVHDALGRLLRDDQTALPLDLDLTAHPAGVYLVTVEQGPRRRTLRIIRR
jgi:hypothetical protein